MSQIIKPLTSSGPIPPIIPTSFVTNSGTATPSANVLKVFGTTSNENNANGIITKAPGSSNEVDVVLTNRAIPAAPVTTAGVATATLISLPLGSVPGTYTFDITVAGFNASTPAGCGFTIVGSARTDGTTATIIPTQVVDHFEEASLVGATAILDKSGNNAVVNVTGVGVLNIDWNGVLNYTFVS